MIPFNADEVFEMAEQIERNGAKFYQKASRRAAGRTAAALLKLADMELQHEKTFHDMRRSMTAEQLEPTGFDPEGQAVAYLRAAADGKVFDISADPAEKLTGKESIREIITTAIGFEKDSILFYVGIKDVVPASRDRDKIDEIIRQEMGHIATLNEELAAC